MAMDTEQLRSIPDADINEFEIVPNSKLRHVHIFLNNITYRNFHFHNEIEIFAVTRGNATIRRSSGSTNVSAGSIVIFNANEVHEINAGTGVDGVICQLSNHFADTYFPRLRNTVFSAEDIRTQMDEDAFRSVWQRIISAAECYIRSENLFELHCVAEVCLLLELLLGKVPSSVINDSDYIARKKISRRMERLYAYIDENYRYPIRLTEVAEAEGITPTHLSHFFTENFGVSFQQYLNNIRFEHAVRLMDNRQMSLSDIAAASGFSDLKYMTRMFVQRFGCKPKEIRDRLGAGQPGQRISSPGALEYQYSPQESMMLLREFEDSFFKNTQPVI